MSKENFLSEIQSAYAPEGPSITLGGGMFEGAVVPGALIQVPLKTINRHGLIAGATGTGKTKSLQVMAEQLSIAGVPSLLMDIKGDLSGIAAKGTDHPKIQERHDSIGVPFELGQSPVEFLTLSSEPGARLRATVIEFGPTLMSKILKLSDVQSGVMAIVFKFCDDNKLPLLDLKDLRKVLQYIGDEGKEEIEKSYGAVASSSLGAIMRSLVELETQGGDKFFGERSFDVKDLMRTDDSGKGVVSVLRLTDIQDKPKLFSTFMLQMLAEIYNTLPEEGDLEKPKLVLFIDEAHLVFNEASDALLDQIESMVKLIRSKGVGLYFITQTPTDIPDSVLGQLGMKIQHALRAFTAKDRKAIKQAAENFPDSSYYKVDELITTMGIGEALVTVLSEKGIPTALAHTMLRAPQSRMDVLEKSEIDAIISASSIVQKYNQEIDSESAYEILNQKIEEMEAEASEEEEVKKAPSPKKKVEKEEEGIDKTKLAKSVFDFATSGRGKKLIRGIFGALTK